ncbi:rRNA maturation RNase YbeY [Salinimicrobium sediminilitoris]|uniref:rRNA maturation RNase YbeY n=1 Tax=Salinimicrobium sediminilitoris TaxID=2876715 RepID=UPI001E47122D|nr:rRNA maturation RNase YbeY [Salinimicrobium sediminilitoris]MCC8359536.1 rRNA maturation RNase YbeY [Salinimicrobium sediminilitoris]
MNEEIINFYSENDFELERVSSYESWVKNVISTEGKKTGEISFVFCDDEYLLEINQKYLDHDTYTDIISFDASVGNILNGDIFISTERVSENADSYEVKFSEELKRVIIHGVLHLCGYKDKTPEEEKIMREKEEEKMKMFHVEQ